MLYLKRINFCVYFCKLKKSYFASTYFCKWQVFENFEFINFIPKEEKNKKKAVEIQVKINRKTGRSQWRNCY